jgi:hypothetical protein
MYLTCPQRKREIKTTFNMAFYYIYINYLYLDNFDKEETEEKQESDCSISFIEEVFLPQSILTFVYIFLLCCRRCWFIPNCGNQFNQLSIYSYSEER